jgi:23S rRNA (guanosine2251-2'-O)-methyltransferase
MKLKSKNSKLYVCGRTVAKEVLEHQRERVQEIYFTKTDKDSDLDKIAQVSRRLGIPTRQLPEKKLKEYVGTAKHQGIVVRLQSFKYTNLKDFMDGLDLASNPAVIIMESIEDPHNVGAIVRSATAMGVAGIIVLNHHQAPVNATSYRTSAGTMGRLPIVRVSNATQTIETLQKAGFWVAGLDMDGEDIGKASNLTGSPMVFVVGNEGSGLKESTQKACDFLFSIPMHNRVESLNASVSIGIILFEWRRKSDMS